MLIIVSYDVSTETPGENGLGVLQKYVKAPGSAFKNLCLSAKLMKTSMQSWCVACWRNSTTTKIVFAFTASQNHPGCVLKSMESSRQKTLRLRWLCNARTMIDGAGRYRFAR